MATMYGSTVYINPALIGGSLAMNEGLVMHEMLHELGLDDTSIQTGLHFLDSSIAIDDKNTKNITMKLMKDCFTGKDNRN